MSVAKLCSSETLNAVKPEEANNTLDNFIRQAIGKEPLLPYPRGGCNSVQWVQLLHAFDQPDLAGWPLMTPLKVQLQKCEKCSREFCSPINYKRHIRVHRRLLNAVNKESHKSRELLAAFWDKLSLDEAKEVVSFNDVMLKEVLGSSLIIALASSLRKPGVWTLPHIYVKAGSTLLDIIQAKPSRLPISSHELFSILDDASENTFLCAGTAESLQKYVFDGEAAQTVLELKNLIASTSFLFEQNLLKAWLVDKDAEALRCQKLLVEEEEAAQKRQATLLERKKKKKLRQKEQKLKEQQLNTSNGDLNVNVDVIDEPVSTEASGPPSPSDSNLNSPDSPTNLDSRRLQLDEDIEAQFDKQGDLRIIEPQMEGATRNKRFPLNRWQVQKLKRGERQHVNQNLQKIKNQPIQKPVPSKVWTMKNRKDTNVQSLKPLLVENNCSCEVIIGTIPVTLANSVTEQDHRPNEALDTPGLDHVIVKKTNVPIRGENSVQSGTNRVGSKLWRPVSRGESGAILPVERGNLEGGGVAVKCIQSQSLDNDIDNRNSTDGNAQQGCLPFSSATAKEFLDRRWKEAVSAEHVKLVFSSGPEPDVHKQVVLGKAENQVVRNTQAKYRTKAEKSVKIKYIPKQKVAA